MDSTTRLNAILAKSAANGGGISAPVAGVAPDNQAKLDQIFSQVAPQAAPAPAPAPEKKSVGGFVKNVVHSGADLLGGIVNALVHPIDTAKNLGGLVLGAGEKLVGYQGDAAAKVDQVVNYYKNRYGKDIGNTLYSDPIGVLADLSTVLGGGGALLKAAGKVAELSDVARASGAANTALRYGSMASKAAEVTDPLRLASKGAGFVSRETGATAAATKAKEFVSNVFTPKAEAATEATAAGTRGAAATPKVPAVSTTGIRGKLDEMALNSGMDKQTQTILRKPLPGEKPAQTAARLEKDYAKYSKAEEAYKVDPSGDNGLQVVGTEIGNGYKDVIKKQQELGKLIGQARKESTSLVDIKPAVESLQKNIADSGLIKTKKGYKVGPDGTPLAPHDISMLKTAEADLKKLGKNPTAQAVSNFKTQLSAKVDFAKGKSALYKPTNAERIIGNIYHELDNGLNVKGKPDLQGIYAMNKEYSRLNNLLEAGDGILGKKTLSGDFTHDAGLAKASIKSLHSGGKKDFLVALGKETGNDYIQKATVAAQAMKDAGNYQQASLLEELANGIAGNNDQLRVSIGKGGIRPQAIVRESVGKVVDTAVGRMTKSPKERTIRYIKEGDAAATKTRGAAKATAAEAAAAKPSRIKQGLRQLGFSNKPGSSAIRTRNAQVDKALGVGDQSD